MKFFVVNTDTYRDVALSDVDELRYEFGSLASNVSEKPADIHVLCDTLKRYGATVEDGDVVVTREGIETVFEHLRKAIKQHTDASDFITDGYWEIKRLFDNDESDKWLYTGFFYTTPDFMSYLYDMMVSTNQSRVRLGLLQVFD